MLLFNLASLNFKTGGHELGDVDSEQGRLAESEAEEAKFLTGTHRVRGAVWLT